MGKRAWEQALATSGHLYTQADCGCLALVMYDIPEVVHDARADITEQALMGRGVKRCARGELPPFNCAEHEAARLAGAAS